MITAGIDVGAASTKAVIMDGDNILAKFRQLAEGEEEQVIKDAFEGALKEAGKSQDDIEKIVATGAGAKNVAFADDTVQCIAPQISIILHIAFLPAFWGYIEFCAKVNINYIIMPTLIAQEVKAYTVLTLKLYVFYDNFF